MGWHRTGLAQHRGHRRQLGTRHTLRPESHQQTTGEHGVDLLRQPAVHQRRGLIRGQPIPLQQLLQKGGPGRGLGHGDQGGDGPWEALTAGAGARKKPGCKARRAG